MAPRSVPQYAVIRSERSVIKSMARKVFADMGIGKSQIYMDEPLGEILEHLKENPDTFIFVDWNLGPKLVLPIINAASHSITYGQTLVILIASEMSADILGYGDEMAISRVHSGDLSATNIKFLIQDVLDSWMKKNSVSEMMQQLAKIREREESAAVVEFLRAQATENPDNPMILSELAQELMSGDLNEEALEVLLPLQKLNPVPSRILHLLGRCHLKLGDLAKATQILEAARLINPYNVDRLLMLGKSYLKMHQIQKARARFDEALSIDPKGKDAIQGRGTVKLLDGEINEGLQLIQQSANKTELASIFNTAAVISIRNKRFEQGIELYSTAIEACRTEPKTVAKLHFNKGIAYYKLRDRKQAIEEFTRALQSDAHHEGAAFNLKILKDSSGSHAAKRQKEPLSSMPKSIDAFSDIFDDSFEFEDE